MLFNKSPNYFERQFQNTEIKIDDSGYSYTWDLGKLNSKEENISNFLYPQK